MKARAVVGKTIVAVEQHRVEDETRKGVLYNVSAIVLDDGTRLTFQVAELESDYAVTCTAYKHGKKVG